MMLDKNGYLDCGDNSCVFASERGGMRTNGGCRCLRDMDLAVEERRAIHLTFSNERRKRLMAETLLKEPRV